MKLPDVVFAAVFAALAFSFHAKAEPQQTVRSVASFRKGNFGSSHAILLNGFYVGSPSGGGILTYNPFDTKSADNSCTVYVDAAGHRFQRELNGKPINLSMCGARCGGIQVTDGHSTGGLATITSATAHWTPAMVGWVAVVNKAANGGKQLVTTVSEVGSARSLTLAAAVGVSGTTETVSLYPDDTTEISNAITAANAADVPASLPAGQTCGMSNPGKTRYVTITFPTLYLNGGSLWLGQTGPVSDTGWALNVIGKCNLAGSPVICAGTTVVGPGIIDGLYQTDQGVRQNSLLDALLFNNSPGVIENAGVIGKVTVQNTKGVAIVGQNVRNFRLVDVTANNCGDFSYHNSDAAGDMAGRPMCVVVQYPTGNLTISNLIANNAAQSGLLIQNSGSNGPANFHAQVSGCSFTGNGYYGLDVEQIDGSIDVSNCKHLGNGIVPRGVTVMGGYIFRDVAFIRATNIQSDLTDSNALVAESVDSASNQTDWSFTNLDVSGTANHAGAVYIAFGYTGHPQRIALNTVKYDTLTVAPAGSPPCSPATPQFQLFKFNQIQASRNSGPTYSTIWNPQGAANSMLYVSGANSSLGAVSINSLLPNDKAIYFDFSEVQTNGAPVFTGATRRALYAPQANLRSPFRCP